MDVGASVSRVGSSAQTKAMKAVARTLRVDLSRYNEVRAFAQFGSSDLDTATRNLLNRGEKVTEILKQKQFVPMPLEEQVAALFAGTLIDDLPTAEVQRFEREFLPFLRERYPEALLAIKQSGDLSTDVKEKLEAAVAKFKGTFKASA
jgi:F-type H+-transporting ATPase subunit alpha